MDTTYEPGQFDWNHVRETVRMLHLATGQVEAAMRDSNTSVGVLTDTFTAMAETLDRIDATLVGLPDAPGNDAIKAGIHDDARSVAAKVRQAIIAFQFYDKLVQRLDHVCRGLSSMSELIDDRVRLNDPTQWQALQAQILDKYTMIEERALFEAVMAGTPVSEALAGYMSAHAADSQSGGDIELF
jgi:hypothetical protein